MNPAASRVRRRRAASLLPVLACAVLLLAACGAPAASPPASPVSPTPDATAAAAATTIAQALASVAGGTPTDAPTVAPTDTPTDTPTDAPTAVSTVAPTATPTAVPSATPTPAPRAPRIDLGVLTQALIEEIPLQGTGEPNGTVFVYLDGAIAATAAADAGGAWAVLLAPVAPGEHVLTAAASDAADAAQSAPVRVVVQARPTSTPTPSPTDTPTQTPTRTPTARPSDTPTTTPTQTPSRTPTPYPTATPTMNRLATSVAATITAAASRRATATAQAPTATSTPVSRAPGSDTWAEPVSGMTFVRVPAGEFTMGSNAGDSDEKPPHQVALGDSWLGLTEVTNAQFRPFVEGGGYADASLWTEAGWAWRTENRVTRPKYWNDAKWNRPDWPVVGVSWHEAVAYTRWLTREAGREFRLPTEAEWELACRGTDGRTYPWGDAPPDADRANFDNNVRRTTAVGSYPAGASPSGALDMAGNVREWTGSLYEPYPYDATDGREDPEAAGTRTLRGGAFFFFDDGVRCAYRSDNNPGDRLYSVGFRVVSPGF